MSSLIGRYYRLIYNLRNHVWVDITLEIWVILLLLVLALLFYFGVLPGGATLAILALVLILVELLSQWWATSRFYVIFEAAESTIQDGTAPVLGPRDKVLLRASGVFTVEGKEKRFTDLLAYYRTFDTREHSIMARRTPSRFLALGREKSETLGMWYIFFMPKDLNGVTPGRLYFGGAPNPALRLDYVRFNSKGKARTSVAYLSFETKRSMEQVMADLLLDMGSTK